MTEPFYVAVKASLHASDSSVFGLTPEDIVALSERYPDTKREVINGVLIKACPLKVINSLSELGYRVVCSSGEAETVWTLRREVLVKFELPSGAFDLKGIADFHELIKTEANNVPEIKVKKEDKLGTRPEDYAEFYDYKGSRIYLRNSSSLVDIDRSVKVIINTNNPSPDNPLVTPRQLLAHCVSLIPPILNRMDQTCSKMDHHSKSVLIPSVHQTLDEMDFERGIWTPAIMGDVVKVRAYLKKGVSVDVEDNSGYTALHYAARNGHGHICTTLLEAGASIDKPTRAGGSTALHRAALSGHADTCDVLLRYGANPVSRDVDGRTPLHRAVEGEQRDVIALFLEMMPATAFEKDNKERTPLDYAEENGSLSSIFLEIPKRRI